MKVLASPAQRPPSAWHGRVFTVLGIAALGALAWLGWTSADAQAALESLWALCASSAR
jgi:hypothetical protein